MDGQAAGGQLDEKPHRLLVPTIRYSGRKIKTLQADLLIGTVIERACMQSGYAGILPGPLYCPPAMQPPRSFGHHARRTLLLAVPVMLARAGLVFMLAV